MKENERELIYNKMVCISVCKCLDTAKHVKCLNVHFCLEPQ